MGRGRGKFSPDRQRTGRLSHLRRGKAGTLVSRDQDEDMAWGTRRHPEARPPGHQLPVGMRPQI